MSSSLKKKLALLNKQSRKKSAPQKSRASRSDTQKLCHVLGGELFDTERGELFILRREYPLQQRYGKRRLQESLDFCGKNLAQIYESVKGFQIEDSLFFDTETTGLAGGSGTYAFLLGLGFFEGDCFVSEQLLMRDHADEAALLSHFSKRLRSKKSLVSFNGRSFDAQLMATRFAMHRMPENLQSHCHLDLLHLSRRLWGFSPLPDCRLETLESRILGAPRHQDVPGWMIPQLFFDFLRDRNPAPLIGVLEHNRRDILAMVALCAQVHDLMTCDTSPDPHVALGLARIWAQIGIHERADHFFRQSLKNRELGEEAKEKALLYWARELKRRRRLPDAALLWRKLLTHYPGNLEATVELAKWFEHQEKDYHSALLLVEGGLRDRSLTSVKRQHLEHRANRLRQRLG